MSQTLVDNLKKRFASLLTGCELRYGDEVTIEVSSENIREVCLALRDEPQFEFKQLIDLCGVDYLTYGDTEWATESASSSGFSRGRVKGKDPRHAWQKERFAVVYHLISYSKNERVRIRSFVAEDFPVIASVMDIWQVADWFEREAFDLYGIIFEGHPDLRRILTDYGFIGHPLRKDFPLTGEVEMRYDEEKTRVVYEPVSIDLRVLVPKVIRDDNRYLERATEEESNG
ncbi:MAG: NADH-quinone oxidoreductase subunit C [Gammaproteobacteria bacterium]|nr:NADH-quinone oxidoreductase subunit C [Gammaproteobacteria bacterium]